MLQPSDRAPGLFVGEGLELPASVEIGAHVVIHDLTVVGEGVRIQDGVVLGKPVALSRTSTASPEQPVPAVVGPGATIAAGAIVSAGVWLGEAVFIGDQTQVRERTTIGAFSVIGRGSAIDNDVAIGQRVKVQTGCYITAFSEIEDDVFVAPGVFTTNDNAMGRHPAGQKLRGAILRRACRVGGGAVLLPGIEVGEEAFVAAGSVVTRDVPARTLVMGAPARRVRDVGDEELLERWQ